MKIRLLAALLMLALGASANAQIDTFKEIGAAFKNSTLEAAVSARLRFNKQLFWEAIEVKADNGVVTVSGYVPSDLHMELALKIAAETQGVKRVVNTLVIGKKPD
jgi:osmotically-inducible protein OsmY